MIKKIGNYYLNQDINSADGLIEFSENEYSFAEQVGMKRIFEDEKMFYGNNVEFGFFTWESPVVGSTQGKIYKIALQLNPDNKTDMEIVFNSVSNYIKDEIGESSQHLANKEVWDTDSGNILLTQASKLGFYAVNLFFTSNLIGNQAQKHKKEIRQNLNTAKKQFNSFPDTPKNFFHNPNNYSDEQNLRWCWLRGNEWGAYPLYISQIIVPLLLAFIDWRILLGSTIVITWLWTFVRYKFVNLLLASISGFVIVLKWIVSIGMAIYFLIRGQYFLATISGLYPLLVLVLMLLIPPAKIGVLQNMFLNKLGYYQE